MSKQEVANYIRSKKHLIEAKDLDALYNECVYEYRSILTDLFLEMKINPLMYMTKVPDGFAKELFISTIDIPTNITSIESYAFSSCDRLVSVKIPDSVKIIGADAFAVCDGLTSVTIGDGVEYIGDSAFYHCTGLKSIDIPGSVISIDNSAFRYCSGLTNVVIGDGVEDIGSGAFYNCLRLIDITIPNTVGYIGYAAFGSCGVLNNIKYMGSKKEWDSIDKEYQWDIGTSNYTVHCTDGIINKGGA